MSLPEHNGLKQQCKGKVKKTDRNDMDDLGFFYIFIFKANLKKGFLFN